MVGWHHRLSGHDFEQTSGDSEGQGNLLCYSLWSCRELDMIKRLNKNNMGYRSLLLMKHSKYIELIKLY